MSRTLLLGLLCALIVALALRCPQLGIRPMHNDEAVNAIKLRALLEQGSYQYDPIEYHGPTLLYASLAWVKLVGPRNFSQLTETSLRTVTILFGVGLILLLPLVADGLGRQATFIAALFIAISPAMVFYSRYFIHEMLLVFFSFLAFAAAWRYYRSRKFRWALLLGIALGLMQATKETFVFSIVAFIGALILNQFFTQPQKMRKRPWNWGHIVAAIGAWAIVWITLFSSFFTNAHGPLDAFKTYLTWMHRAGGESKHIHPWNFYLERLAWFQHGQSAVWSEGLILVFAVMGFFFAVGSRPRPEGRTLFVRVLALYTVLLTVIYFAVAYKTPWCLLQFWHGMILLAGVGLVGLFDLIQKRSGKIALAIMISLAAAQLTAQAWRAGVTDSAGTDNPYVYAQTSPDIYNLINRVNALAQLRNRDLEIKVIAPESEYWPLPWYLRQYPQIGWWDNLPPDSYAPIMIVSAQFQTNLENSSHTMVGMFELRPQTFFELYVDSNLWRDYVNNRPKTNDQ